MELLLLLLLQAPQITNATVVPVAAPIEQAVTAAASERDPSWVAWKVPAVDASRNCCWQSVDGQHWYGCGLEPHDDSDPPARPAQPAGPVPLEPSTTMLVMARVAEGRLERVRTFSSDCPLDAGGRTVRLVEGVTPEASVRWLAERLTREDDTRVRRGFVRALGQSDSTETVPALIAIATTDTQKDARREAMRSLGRSKDPRALAFLQEILLK